MLNLLGNISSIGSVKFDGNYCLALKAQLKQIITTFGVQANKW